MTVQGSVLSIVNNCYNLLANRPSEGQPVITKYFEIVSYGISLGHDVLKVMGRGTWTPWLSSVPLQFVFCKPECISVFFDCQKHFFFFSKIKGTAAFLVIAFLLVFRINSLEREDVYNTEVQVSGNRQKHRTFQSSETDE